MNIIPMPLTARKENGVCIINAESTVCADGVFKNTVDLINAFLYNTVGYNLKTCERGGQIKIIYSSEMAKERYIVDVKDGKITVTASAPAGALYAFESIRQLSMPELLENGADITVPCCYIDDKPRYEWRALHFDEARHFFGKEFVKNLLSMMAYNKLNVFHWHLTDDSGWRVEIKAFPRLREVGSKRKDTQTHGWRRPTLRGEPHEGFYSQEDIKEVVAYAAALGITVVPEIDMPAHFVAAIASYNYLSCAGDECEVEYFFGSEVVPKSEGRKYTYRIACAGKETTYEFIYKVIDELCELFPAPYFHIGGDEAPKTEWAKCPHCQKVIKDNNLSGEFALQGYFNNKIADYLAGKGKKTIGWNEILSGDNLRDDTLVQYWTATRSVRTEKFANKGGKVIISKHQAFYFDMPYAQTPLKHTYRFEPEKLHIKRTDSVKGLEGCLWTEWIADKKKFDLCAYPRMLALSEVCWSNKYNRNYDDFMNRWNNLKPVYNKLGIAYAKDKLCNIPWHKQLKQMRKFHRVDPNIEVEINDKL